MQVHMICKAKAANENVWVFGYFHEGYSTNDYRIMNKYEDRVIDIGTLCRPVGLTDKAGNDLYEHDIIMYTNGIQRVVGVINYGHGTGCWCIQDIRSLNNPAIEIVMNEADDFYKIGNKFDDKAFLEGCSPDSSGWKFVKYSQPEDIRRKYLVLYDNGELDVCEYTNVSLVSGTVLDPEGWRWNHRQFCRVLAYHELPELPEVNNATNI